MSEVQGKAFDLKLLGRVLEFMKPYRIIFWLTALLTIVLGFMAPIRPALIQKGLDEQVMVEKDAIMLHAHAIFPDQSEAWFEQLAIHIDASREDNLLEIIIWIFVLLFFEAFLQFFQTYYANWIGQSVTLDLRNKLYRHVTGFRLKYFDNTPIGTLVTRVVSDIDGIAQIFSQGLLTIIGDILKLVVVVVVMFYINWQLALIVLIPIPILVIATRIFKNAIKKAFTQVRNQVARSNAFVQEHVTGMNIVQIFNREKQEMKKFETINKAHRRANIHSIWAYAIFFPVVEMLSATSVALLLWLGLKQSLPENPGGLAVSYGNLVQYILYVFMLYRPIRQLADHFNTLQMGIVNAHRVFNVLDRTNNHIKEGHLENRVFKGNIRFEKVWFAYTDENFVLKEVTFHIKAGEMLAFVGATGAGKSSVINILSRFYEYQKGSIEIDGNDLRDHKISTIRKNIAVVLQDVFLFSDTIHNNITLHDPNISREQVTEAAKAVGAHDFIMKMPGGYDYDVRERGGMLSTGQRQLIAFIRAYVYNPGILILDEATSNIDTESELLIQRAIRQLTRGRTSIVIAHRLSTIQQADRIVVLDKGHILEMGNHEELLARKGQYHRLFELQFS